MTQKSLYEVRIADEAVGYFKFVYLLYVPSHILFDDKPCQQFGLVDVLREVRYITVNGINVIVKDEGWPIQWGPDTVVGGGTREVWIQRLLCGNIGCDVRLVISVRKCEAWNGLLLSVWQTIRLQFIGFYFDVCVVVIGRDIAWLLVGYIGWNLVDGECDIRDDALGVELWLCRQYVTHTTLDCDVMKVMGETIGDGRVDLSGKVL